jgi:hypothetical protein
VSANANDWCEAYKRASTDNKRLRADLAEARELLAEARELIDELNWRVDSWSATEDLKTKADAFLERTKEARF